jgi:hypothetical protein
MNRNLLGALAVGLTLSCLAKAQEGGLSAPIRASTTFWASFDRGADADFAKGDKRIFTAASAKRDKVSPGLPQGDVEIAKGQGRGGSDALRFLKKSNRVVFFQAAGNIDYRKRDWSGTVSFWLSLDPHVDLGNWFCDPIQITEKAWNDGGLWVDFSKDERPKLFRLGVFADFKVWNPDNRDYEKMTPAERPMATAPNPVFARGKWTHVAIAFEKFNTGKPDGVAKLFLDGKLQGTVSGRNQQFTWNVDKAAIQLGMNYVGVFDDLSIYNRALSDAEIESLHAHKGRLMAK